MLIVIELAVFPVTEVRLGMLPVLLVTTIPTDMLAVLPQPVNTLLFKVAVQLMVPIQAEKMV